jgi:hypothetical protein
MLPAAGPKKSCLRLDQVRRSSLRNSSAKSKLPSQKKLAISQPGDV